MQQQGQQQEQQGQQQQIQPAALNEFLNALSQFTQQLGIQSTPVPPTLLPNLSGTRTNEDNVQVPSERSLSPVLRRNIRRLSPMSKNFKKTLHVN